MGREREKAENKEERAFIRKLLAILDNLLKLTSNAKNLKAQRTFRFPYKVREHTSEK